jgi:hypothetical protein
MALRFHERLPSAREIPNVSSAVRRVGIAIVLLCLPEVPGVRALEKECLALILVNWRPLGYAVIRLAQIWGNLLAVVFPRRRPQKEFS